MKEEVFSDATVTFADALRWVEPLIKTKPDDVITRALAVEPAVLAVAVDQARRTCERLEKCGVSEELCQYITRQMTLTGAISIELMRHGQATLWDDMINPDNDDKPKNPTGEHHG